MANLVAPQQEQKGNGDCADEIHEGRGKCLGAHRTEIGAEEFAGGLAKTQQLPELHVEGFNDAIASDRLVQDVLDIGELVLALAGGPPHIAADPPNRSGDDRQKDQQHPRQLATDDAAYCTRSMSLISAESSDPVVCFWKKETERRRIASYKSSRMSVIMPKPA